MKSSASSEPFACFQAVSHASCAGKYPDGHLGIRTLVLRGKLEADASNVERGTLVPGPDASFEPPDV